MTLRTVAIPDPAPGIDWSTVVPGNWLYDITGITATLTTTGDTPTTAVNAANPGADGMYGYSGGYPKAAAGLVSGDTAKQFANPAVPGATPGTISIPDIGFDAAGTFTVVWWATWAQVLWNGPVVAAFSSLAPERWRVGGDQSGVGFGILTENGVTSGGAAWNVSASMDALPHFYMVSWDGVDFHLWVDAVELVPTLVLGPPGFTGGETWSAIMCDDGINTGINATLDEFALVPSALVQSDADDLYAARGDFATYTAIQLILGPQIYFHLDDVSPGTPRQVTLVVATSTGVVADICSGFPLASGAGPYGYSWQPHLTSNSQAPDGSTTSIAIPRLILPAGYSISSDTLDLAAGDQWSDITLWWDDTFMLSLADVNPYVYPPGVKLVYRPQGAT